MSSSVNDLTQHTLLSEIHGDWTIQLVYRSNEFTIWLTDNNGRSFMDKSLVPDRTVTKLPDHVEKVRYSRWVRDFIPKAWPFIRLIEIMES